MMHDRLNIAWLVGPLLSWSEARCLNPGTRYSDWCFSWFFSPSRTSSGIALQIVTSPLLYTPFCVYFLVIFVHFDAVYSELLRASLYNWNLTNLLFIALCLSIDPERLSGPVKLVQSLCSSCKTFFGQGILSFTTHQIFCTCKSRT
jgi:hypothetical protein